MRLVPLALLVMLLAPTAIAGLGVHDLVTSTRAPDAPPTRNLHTAAHAGAASATAAVAEDGRYWFYFDCPSEPTSAITSSCPTRLGVDGAALGAPSVIIDPANPYRVLIAALAGTLGDDGRSRTGDTMHVLFASEDAGRTFTPIDWPAASGATAARDIQVVIDPAGRVTLAALYTGASGDFLATWTLPNTPAAPLAPSDARVLSPWIVGAVMDRVSLTITPNGTRVLLWEEHGTAPDARAAHGESEWVRTAIAHADADWQLADGALLAAPCDEVSNVVTTLTEAFFACRARGGLWPEHDVAEDALVLHAISLSNGTADYRNRAPFTGTPTLGATPDGRIAVAVLSTDDGRFHLRFTTARNGFNWTSPGDPGLRFHPPEAPLPENPRVLALAFRGDYRMWHLVYSEDLPTTSSALPPTEPRENKTAFALSERGSIMFRMGLNVDQFANRPLAPSPSAPLAPAALARDRHDAIQVLGTREVLVYTDAGQLVVALVEEASILPTPGAVPERLVPQQVVTQLTQQPAREFTLIFEIATGVLVTLVLARVLVGRIIVRSAAPEPGEESP